MSKRPQNPFDFDCSKLTPDELRERLKEAGYPVDSWVSNEGQSHVGSQRRLPMFDKYVELLVEMRGLIEKQVAQDVEHVDRLHVEFQRLKRGGGI